MKKPLKIGAYLRVSTDRQVQVFEGSLDTQKFRMKEFVKLRNLSEKKWGEIEDFYLDEGFSAGTDRRPEYQRLMSDIRKGKIDLILVADLSRLSRNVSDFCDLQAELQKHGAGFFSMKEQFDTSTPSGRMMMNVMISMSQFEREQTSERVAINCNARALRGYVNGGRPILGYNKHPEKKGVLIVNNEEAKIVRTIFKTFLEQGTRAKTANRLHEIGVYPQRSKTLTETNSQANWTPQILSNILTQAAYIGLREVNRTYKNQDQSNLKPWQQYKLVSASWPAIIEECEFNEAQKLLKEAQLKEREKFKSSTTKSYFLSHLLKCAHCGRALVGQSAHGRNGTVHRYYHHSRNFNDNCPTPRLSANALEDKLVNHLRAGLEAAGYAKHLEHTLTNSAKSNSSQIKEELDRANRDLQSIEGEIAGVWRLQSAASMGEESLILASQQLDKLAKNKSQIEKYICELQTRRETANSISEQAAFVETNLRNLVRGWSKATSSIKKRLLRRAIKEITISTEEMKVTFWLSENEREPSIGGNKLRECFQDTKVLPFRRAAGQSAGVTFEFDGSYVGLNGGVDGTRTRGLSRDRRAL